MSHRSFPLFYSSLYNSTSNLRLVRVTANDYCLTLTHHPRLSLAAKFCSVQMVRFGDKETVRVGVLLRRNVFYEGEVMKLLETLTKAYEVSARFPHRRNEWLTVELHPQPFHMPPTYMADCVVMTHAVLKQLESYGSSGDRVRYRD